jgi:hypothetical protein
VALRAIGTKKDMSDEKKLHPLIRAEEIKKLSENSFSHPWNPNSEIHGHFLGNIKSGSL